MRAEISYDLVMDEDMEFVEGTYRLPEADWQVFIFSRRDVIEPQVNPTRWESGITGVFVRFPRQEQLNQAVVERVLSEALGVGEWVTLHGPDSMQLR
jgi:hypothetical protein